MGESISSSPCEVKQKTLEEYFNEALPYLMAIGMSYDEFWYKQPQLAKHYLKAHEIRQKQENERLWLQGYYNYIALCSVSPILHAFAKKGTKPIDYPHQPLSLDEDEAEKRKEAERQARLAKLKQKLFNSIRR